MNGHDGIEHLVRVKVRGVYLAESDSGALSPVVLLEDDRSRVVPVFVGLYEALSIHQALSGEVSPRPMTHDLFISTLESFKAVITKVLIDDLEGGIYYARLSIKRETEEKEIDARPSDCLALAIRAKAPIDIIEHVIEQSSLKRSEMDGLKSLDIYLQEAASTL